jgi:hypothetical protein
MKRIVAVLLFVNASVKVSAGMDCVLY